MNVYSRERQQSIYNLRIKKKNNYKSRGFDIYDENHTKIDSGSHKVDSETYNEALDKIVELEAKVLELSKKGNRKGNNKGNETAEEATEEAGE